MVSPPSQAVLDRELPVHQPDRSALTSPPAGKVQVTWLGHASVLVQCDGWCILADPLFSERCGPVQWAGPARAKRVRPAPIQVAELPHVDVIVISHNHYDHLDETSVRDLARAQPHAIFFVPLGMKSWFRSLRLHRTVVEMDWSESVVLHESDMTGTGGTGRRPDLTVVCVPCQHWCNRGALDVNKCLWSSWVCKSDTFAYYFGESCTCVCCAAHTIPNACLSQTPLHRLHFAFTLIRGRHRVLRRDLQQDRCAVWTHGRGSDPDWGVWSTRGALVSSTGAHGPRRSRGVPCRLAKSPFGRHSLGNVRVDGRTTA